MKIIDKAMEETTLDFFKKAKYDGFVCDKCCSLMWLTKDNCPDCEKPYPSEMKNRTMRMKYIFNEYLSNRLFRMGYTELADSISEEC